VDAFYVAKGKAVQMYGLKATAIHYVGEKGVQIYMSHKDE
jgi:hypothetical protein